MAPQALFLMNSSLVARESEKLAQTLLAEPGDDRGRVIEAFERFYSRSPTESDIASLLEFMQSYEKILQTRGIAIEQCRLEAGKLSAGR